MTTWAFHDAAHLLAAIRMGRVPEKILSSPCWVDHTDGIRIQLTPGDGFSAAPHWAATVPLVPAPLPTVLPRVVFRVEPQRLDELVIELLELGAATQSWQLTPTDAWVRVAGAPWFSVLGRMCFLEVADEVFVRAGFGHPLPLQSAAHTTTLVDPDGWTLLGDDWTPVEECLQIIGPPRVTREVVDAPAVVVPLRLGRVPHRAPAALWTMGAGRRDAFDAWMERATPEMLASLQFAVSEDPWTLVLMAAADRPTLPPVDDSYARHPHVPELYIPIDHTILPPLTAQSLRDALQLHPRSVHWWAPDGALVVLPAHGFRPLSSWVDHVFHGSVRHLAPWVESATLSFPDVLPRIHAARADAARSPATDEPAWASDIESPPDDAPPSRPDLPRPDVPLPKVPPTRSSERVELETQLLALAPTDPRAAPLWRALIPHLGVEGPRAWAQAVFASPAPDTDLAAWADSLTEAADSLRERAMSAPGRATLEPLVPLLATGRIAADSTLAHLFDQHHLALDIRSAWLALSALAGDDPIARTRMRDNLVVRMRTGLDPTVDLLSFQRLADPSAADALAGSLAALHPYVRQTPRQRAVIEAPEALTQAYVDRIFAWAWAGLARQPEQPPGALPLADPVHAALHHQFLERTDARAQGHAPAPLSDAQRDRLATLGALERYKVDRLRNESDILEPHRTLDPFATFSAGARQPFGAAFTGLTELTDSDLHARLMELAPSADPEGVLSFAHGLPPSLALPVLLAVPPTRHTLPLALQLAARTGAVAHYRSLLATLSSDEPIDPALARALTHSARMGAAPAAMALLDSAPMVPGPDGVLGRLALARLGSKLGIAVDETVLDEAHALIDRAHDRPMVPVHLARELAGLLATLPLDPALAHTRRLATGLVHRTDSFNTNSHFCLSVLSFVESLVLAHGTDARLPASARQHLDTAEFDLRMRLGP